VYISPSLSWSLSSSCDIFNWQGLKKYPIHLCVRPCASFVYFIMWEPFLACCWNKNITSVCFLSQQSNYLYSCFLGEGSRMFGATHFQHFQSKSKPGKKTARSRRLGFACNLFLAGQLCGLRLALADGGSTFLRNTLELQNYWVFGLCPSSDIQESRKHNVSETVSVSVLRLRGRHVLCWVP
jgi:hypothetical protein